MMWFYVCTGIDITNAYITGCEVAGLCEEIDMLDSYMEYVVTFHVVKMGC